MLKVVSTLIVGVIIGFCFAFLLFLTDQRQSSHVFRVTETAKPDSSDSADSALRHPLPPLAESPPDRVTKKDLYSVCEDMLPSGVPTMAAYYQAKERPVHAVVKSWWDNFGRLNDAVSNNPKAVWEGAKLTLDTLEQWSRNYEYVYHYAALNAYVTQILPDVKRTRGDYDSPAVDILDAGSGITPFTWLATTVSPHSAVVGLDVYQQYDEIFGEINRRTVGKLNSPGPAKDVMYVKDDIINFVSPQLEAKKFDVVHCISVLEHTKQYGKVVDNFYDHLKPGGVAIITFDIKHPNTIAKMQELSDYLLEKFGGNQVCPPQESHSFAELHSISATTHLLCAKYFTGPESQKTLPWCSPRGCSGNFVPPEVYVNMVVMQKPLL